MIRMTFECPQTGRPLPTMRAGAWSERSYDVRVALHCPRCSQTHYFSRDQAILEVVPAAGVRERALAASA